MPQTNEQFSSGKTLNNGTSTIYCMVSIEIHIGLYVYFRQWFAYDASKAATDCWRHFLKTYVVSLLYNLFYVKAFFILHCILQTRTVKMHLNSTRNATRCTKTRKFRGQPRTTDVCRTTAVWLSFVAITFVVSFQLLWSLKRRGLDYISRSGNGQVIPHLMSLLS